MRKSLAVASLLLMALVGGCGDKNTQVDATSAEPTPTTSGSGTPAPEQSSAITEQDFCDNIVEIFSMHDKKSGTDPPTDLMADRSEERRVGKERVRTCRTRCSTIPSKKKQTQKTI